LLVRGKLAGLGWARLRLRLRLRLDYQVDYRFAS
jgi:hypothetical protein